jgi:hypothetical protein
VTILGRAADGARMSLGDQLPLGLFPPRACNVHGCLDALFFEAFLSRSAASKAGFLLRGSACGVVPAPTAFSVPELDISRGSP